MGFVSPAWRALRTVARGVGLLASGPVLALAVVLTLVLVRTLGLVMPEPVVGSSPGAFGWIAQPSFASAAWAAELPAARSSTIPQEPLISARPETSRAVIPAEGHYLCDGETLSTVFQPGAVDALDLPNQSAGTLPGSFLLVRWRGIQLQLPRTNDAGPPRFSDGKWLWQFNPGQPPRFLLRQGLGQVEEFSCAAVKDPLAGAFPADG